MAADVGPEHVAQSLAPAVRLAEQIEQALLVLSGVAAARRLRSGSGSAARRCRIGSAGSALVTAMRNAEQGRGREWDGRRALHAKIEIRHDELPRQRPLALSTPRRSAPTSSHTSVAAGESAPMRADQADQLEALIDGQQEILVDGKAARRAQAIHQQRLDVRLHGLAARDSPRRSAPRFRAATAIPWRPPGWDTSRSSCLDALLAKKNAMLMGTIRLSHCASVKLEVGQEANRARARVCSAGRSAR